ncbi:MAG: hypothetical protein C1O27_000386 [Chloroflexi bacterium]|jgi:hypothetical protein|nr:MAG: hypothetical protein C1O27_000386 [Chloroflexota bacterium]
MPKLERWGGLVALLSGILGVLYFPFDSAALFAASDATEFTGFIPWSDAFRDLAAPLLTFDSPAVVHRFYARLSFIVILGFAVGLVALHSRQAGKAGRLERWGFYVTLVGLALIAASVFVERWIGGGHGGPSRVGDWAFVVLEVPSLLLLIPGLPLFGIGTLRAKVAPRLGAWLLTISVPAVVLLTLLLGHLSGGMLVLDLAWMVLGYHLWSQRATAKAATAEV